MFTLALSSLRYRKAALAGAFLTLFCAAALVTACGMLMETGLRGRVAPERYAGAPVIVAGDPSSHFVEDDGDRESEPNTARAWLPAALADRLRDTPGVGKVVTEVTFPAFLTGGPASGSWGHGWESAELAPFTPGQGRAPAADDEIVVDGSARLAPGATATVLTPSGAGTYRVVGVTTRRTAGRTAVFFTTAEAQRLAAHPGQVTAIGVWPAGAASAVRDVVRDTPGATVHTGHGRGRVEFPATDAARTKLISMGAALGGTSLIVALLAVTGTFGPAIRRREREIALLRAVAATPRQIRRMIGREALLLGVGAAVPGAAAGLLLGSWLHGVFVDHGAIPPNMPLVFGVFAPLVAVAVTVPAAWAAALLSARRAARLRPVEALGEAALAPARVPWLRVAAGLIVTAGAIVLTLLLPTIHTEAGSAPLTPITALTWATAVTFLGPLVALVTIAPLALPLRAAGGTAALAAAGLRTGARRLAAVISPLTLMVTLACTLLFAQTTLSGAADSQARAGIVADHVFGPRVPAPAADALRGVPGVRAVTEVLHTRVRTADSPYSAQGVTPDGLERTMDLDVRSGSLDRLGEGTMAVREGLGMKVGDEKSFALADGTPVTLRVVAVYQRGLGFGDLTLPHSLVAAHVDVPMGSVLVSAPGVPRETLSRAVAAHPGVVPQDGTGVPGRGGGGGTVNYIALGLIVAFAAISMVNTLAMDIAGRSRELALLRLSGATRRQVLRMLCWETLTVVVIAVVLGSAIAWTTLTAFSSGMTGSGTLHIPPAGGLAIVAVTAVLALAATILPARGVLRAAPAHVVASRE